MATYLSTPYQGSRYIPTIPLDIVAQGLGIKQKVTDEFRAHNQGILDELGKNTFYRDSDLNYVNSKLRETVDALNDYSGQDLTDGHVQGQINSLMNGLTGDASITKRIIANKQRGKTVNDMLEVKEKHPELWNMQNYLDWKAQDDEWKGNPDKIDYTATYQPYIDTHKYDEEAQKDILSNPIVRAEIDYYTDAKGVKHRRGEREIAEVTKSRLKSAMISGMPDNVKGQHQLEYRNFIRSLAPEQVASMIRSEVETYQNLLDGFNAICSNPQATQKDRDEANELAIKAEQAIKVGKESINDVLTGKRSTSDFMTFDKYIDSKYDKIAAAHAYSKQGKYNYDDLFMENIKAQHAQQLKHLEHKLKMSENPPSPLNNDFVNNVLNALISPNSTIQANTMADLLGLTGKQDDNGYYNLPIQGTDIQLNTTPIIQTYLPQADNRKVMGMQALKQGYAIYKAQHPAGQPVPVNNQSWTDPNTGNAYTWSGANNQSIQAGHVVSNSVQVSKEPSFEDYLSTLKQSSATIEQYKNNYGIDLNNPQDLQDSKKAQITLSQKVGEQQAFRFNKGAGNIKITTTVNGGNLFRGDDGELHIATTALATKAQIAAGLGYDPSSLIGSPGSPNLIMPSGKYAGKEYKDGYREDDELYSFPVILKVSGDMMAKFNENLNNHSGLGSTELKDNRGKWNSEFANRFAAVRAASSFGYQDIPTSTLRTNLVAKIQELIPDAIQQAQYINAADQYINMLNSGATPETKAVIYNNIYKIMSAKPGDKI